MIKFLLRLPLLLLQTLIVPVILVMILLGAIFYLGETTSGIVTSVNILNKFIPGHLEIKEAQGKLFSQFALKRVTYQDATSQLSMDDLVVAWEPHHLLQDKLHIERLISHNMTVKTITSKDTKPLSFDDLGYYFKHVHIEQADIAHLSFAQDNNKPFVVNQIRLHQISPEHFTFAAAINDGSIEGSLSDRWDAHWNFQVADIANFYPQAHGSFALTGTITGPRLTPTLMASINGNKITADNLKLDRVNANINLILIPETQSSVTLNVTGVTIADHPVQNFTLAANGKTVKTAKNWDTSLSIALNNKPYITLQLSLPQTFKPDNYAKENIVAKLNINTIDLNTLAKYIPAVKNLRGNLQGTLAFDGSLQHPRLNGNLELDNGNFTVPELNVTLEKFNLRASADESKVVSYNGSFTSGNGSAVIHGSTDLGQSGLPTTITVQGKDLLAVNLEEYKIHVTPDLTIKLAGNTVSLLGKVFIPQAKISPKNFNGVVTLPSDVVFVGEEKKSEKASTMMAYLPVLRLEVSLGDDIYLHYQDLEATLRGSVKISKDANNTATGVGELYATKGTYNAYQKILTIKEGRIIYTGNLITNPGLNIKASREMDTVATGSVNDFTTQQAYSGTEKLTVGVQVLGTLDKPKITLFSNPTLSQNDTLSYLILGVPYNRTSSNNKQSIMSAASLLKMGSGGASSHLAAITQNIQNTFGLSELNVESVQTFNKSNGGVDDNTSLVVGKQLSSRLYVHYSTSFDLNKPISVFNLRYKLSKRFSIQSETSTIDTGADLLYSIERG